MNVLKYIAAAVVAVSLAGCGDDCCKDKSCDGKAAAGQTEKAAAGYTAKVASDAQFALFCCDNGSPVIKSFVALYKKAFAMAVAEGKSGAKDVATLIEDLGLDDSKVNWCVASAGGISSAEMQGEPDASKLAIVANVKHDSVRLFAVMSEKINELGGDDIKIVEVSGVKAFKISAPFPGAKGIPFVASLGNELVVFAGSEEILKAQIALYQGNAPASTKFDSLFNDKNLVLGASIADIGKLFSEFAKVDPQSFAGADAMLGQINYKEFKALNLGVRADKAGAVTAFAELETASAADATSLAAFAQMGLANLVKMAEPQEGAQSDPDAKLALEVFKAIKVDPVGTVVKAKLPVPQKAIDFAVKELGDQLGNK